MATRSASRTTLSLVVFAVLLVAVPLDAVIAQGRPGEWTKHATNPVFGVGTTGAWDDGDVFDPAILYDGATYRMWYTGDRGSNPRLIGYATSADGLSWTRHAGNPVLGVGAASSWDAEGARLAAVISDGGVFKMWYTGRDASAKNRVGYATSPDGIAWTKYAGNPVLDLGSAGAWDEDQVIGPAVIKDGSGYKMWYEGRNSARRDSIGYATSPDGIHWTKHGGNPVLAGSPGGNWDYAVYGPHVILDSGYRMWYSGCNFNSTACEIGYATSADGIQWTKKGRVLQQGPDGSFDRYSADYPAVLRVGDTYEMWYSGFGGSNGRIGYASAPWLDLAYTAYLPQALRDSGTCNPLWSDDFHDYHSGWPVEDSADVKYAYAGGEYQILAKAADSYFWATPGVQMLDGVIVASMRFGAMGDNSDNGGIMFGQSLDGNENFYRFTVGRNGGYCIQRHLAGVGWDDLSCGTATGYHPYPATNRLKVTRNGTAITAYLNGQWLASVSDSSYLGSLQVGLEVGTGASNADLRFDDYGVYTLSCSDQVTVSGP